MRVALVIAGWSVGLAVAAAAWRAWRPRRQVRDRVFAPVEAESPQAAPDDDRGGWPTRWLALAGYRSPDAPGVFLAAAALAAIVGAGVVFAALQSGLVRTGTAALAGMPGGVGDFFLPVVVAGPWVLGVILATLPWLAVRATRRERVAAVEQDLPLFLELLATLSEAGLAFDAALDRILAAQPPGRPLAEEFRGFQRDALAGVPRVRALRRAAARADVLSLTILVSALVQAEQVGSGVAEVLRRQADDLRGRRRERAMALANTLPVKLLFPLVICFLPGLFVATLGPVFLQFVQFADTVTRNRGLR